MVKEVMDGFNCTIFAYGQTGSGKTHTMMGLPLDPANPDSKGGPDGSPTNTNASLASHPATATSLHGIIPRLVQAIFQAIQNADSAIQFTIKVSMLEIYTERVRDLLNPKSDNLRIRESAEAGIWVEGLSEFYVASEHDVLSIIDSGNMARSVGETNMNERSSRSHSVVIITVGQQNLETGEKRGSKLTLVDLAGSEKVAKTGAEGERLKEAQHINKSLSALGNVINALSTGQPHVPYRDSKLTRLLTDSLGGNSKTALVITCSPSQLHVDETLSTLRFGRRAKNIKNKPVQNRERSAVEYRDLLLEAIDRLHQRDDLLDQIARGFTQYDPNNSLLATAMSILSTDKWAQRLRLELYAELGIAPPSSNSNTSNYSRRFSTDLGSGPDLPERKEEQESKAVRANLNNALLEAASYPEEAMPRATSNLLELGSPSRTAGLTPGDPYLKLLAKVDEDLDSKQGRKGNLDSSSSLSMSFGLGDERVGLDHAATTGLVDEDEERLVIPASDEEESDEDATPWADDEDPDTLRQRLGGAETPATRLANQHLAENTTMTLSAVRARELLALELAKQEELAELNEAIADHPLWSQLVPKDGASMEAVKLTWRDLARAADQARNDLASELKQLEHRLAALQTSAQAAEEISNASLQKAETELQAALKKLQVAETQREKLAQDVQKAVAELEEARDAKDCLEIQLNAAEHNRDEALQTLEKAKSELSDLQREYEHLQRMVADLQTELQTKSAEATRLASDLSASKSSLLTTSNDLARARDEITRLEADLRKASERHTQQVADLESRMQSTKRQLQERITELERMALESSESHAVKIADLERSLEQAEERVHDIEGELQLARNEIKEREALLEESRKRQDDLNERLAAARSELTAAATSHQHELRARNEQAQKLQSQLDRMQEEAETLQARYQAAVQTSEAAKAELESLVKAVEEARAEATKSRRKVTSLETELATAKSEAMTLRNKTTREIEELRTELEAKQQSLTRLQEEHRALSTQYEQEAKQAVDLRLMNKELTAKLESIQRDLASSNASLNTVSEDLARVTEHEKKLESDLKTALLRVAEADRLQQTIEELQQRYTTLAERHDIELKAANAAREAAEAAYESARSTIASLQADVEKRTSAHEEIIAREGRLQAEYDAKLAQIASLEAELKASKAGLEATISELRAQLSALQQASESTSQRLTAERDCLADEIVKLNERLAAEAARYSTALSTFADEKKQLSEAHRVEIELLQARIAAAVETAKDNAEQLAREKRAVEERLRAAQAELSEHKSACEVLREQLSIARSAAAGAGDALTTAENRALELLNQVQHAQRERDELKRELEEQSGMVEQLRTQLAAKGDEVQAAHQREAELKHLIERQRNEFAAELQKAENSVKALESKKFELEQAQEKARAEIVGLNKSLHSLQESQASEVNQLHAKLAALETSKATLESQLQSDTTAHKARLDELTRQMEAQIEHQSRRATEAQSEVQRLQQQLAQLQALVDLESNAKTAAMESCSNLKAQVDKLTAEIAQQRAHSAATEASFEETQRALDQAKKNQTDLQAKLNEATQQLTAAQASLAAMATDKDQTVAQLEVVRAHLAQADRARNEYQTKVNELERRASNAEVALEQTNNKLRSVEGSLTDSRAELEAQHAYIASLKSSIEQTQVQLDEAEKLVAELRAELRTEQGKYGDAASRLVVVQAELDDLRQSYLDIRQTMAQTTLNLESQLAAAEQRANAAEVQFEDLKGRVAEIEEARKRAVERLQEQLQNKEKEWERRRTELEERHSRALSQRNDELSKANAERLRATSKLAEALSTLEQTERRLAAAEFANNESEAKLAAKEKQLAALRVALENGQKSALESARTVARLEHEVRDLNVRLEQQALKAKHDLEAQAQEAARKAENDRLAAVSAMEALDREAQKSIQIMREAAEREREVARSEMNSLRDQLVKAETEKAQLETKIGELETRYERLEDAHQRLTLQWQRHIDLQIEYENRKKLEEANQGASSQAARSEILRLQAQLEKKNAQYVNLKVMFDAINEKKKAAEERALAAEAELTLMRKPDAGKTELTEEVRALRQRIVELESVNRRLSISYGSRHRMSVVGGAVSTTGSIDATSAAIAKAYAADYDSDSESTSDSDSEEEDGEDKTPNARRKSRSVSSSPPPIPGATAPSNTSTKSSATGSPQKPALLPPRIHTAANGKAELAAAAEAVRLRGGAPEGTLLTHPPQNRVTETQTTQPQPQQSSSTTSRFGGKWRFFF